MTIEDLRDLIIDDSQQCFIYDYTSEEEKFNGEMADIPEELLEEEIVALDTIYPHSNGVMGINIEMEGDDD